MDQSNVCLICCSNNIDSNWNSEEEQISKQLAVIFILSKLLKVPSSKLKGYLKEYGNPEGWITLCAQCSKLTSQARELHYQNVLITQKLKTIQLELVQGIKKTDLPDDRDKNVIAGSHRFRKRRKLDRVWEETRDFVKMHVYDTWKDPFDEGNRLPREGNGHKIKALKGNGRKMKAFRVNRLNIKERIENSRKLKALKETERKLQALEGNDRKIMPNSTNGSSKVRSKIIANDCTDTSAFSTTEVKLEPAEYDDELPSDRDQSDGEVWDNPASNQTDEKRSNKEQNVNGDDGWHLEVEEETTSERGLRRKRVVKKYDDGESNNEENGSEESDDDSGDDWDPEMEPTSGREMLRRRMDKIYQGVQLSDMEDFKRMVVKKTIYHNFVRSKQVGGDDKLEEIMMKYKAEQDQLFVEDIQVLIKEQEKCLVCSQCQFTATLGQSRQMVDHIGKIHLHAFLCAICGVEHNTQRYHRDHMKSHQNQSQYPCDICGRIMANLKSLKGHEWSHMNQEEQEEAVANGRRKPERLIDPKSKPFQCTVCGKAFRGMAGLKYHEETHLDNRPTTICPHCGKSVLHTTFDYHLKRCNPENEDDRKSPGPRVKCVKCDKTYANFKLMKIHLMRNHHNPESGDWRYHCTVCGKGFNILEDLKNHSVIHSDARPFCCPNGCGSSYKLKRYLRDHSKTCKGKIGTCLKSETEAM